MGKAEEEFNKKLKEYRSTQEEELRLSKETNDSLKTYAKTKMDIGRLNQQLLKQNKKLAKLRKNIAKADGTKKKELEEEYKMVKKITEQYEDQVDLLKDSIKATKALGGSLKKVSNGIAGGLWKFAKDLPGFFFEQDKAVKMAGLSMGQMRSTTEGMFKSMNKVAVQTNQLGVGMKDLAKMQQAYAAGLGTTIQLSQDGLTAMASLREGAFMGDDAMVSEFANSMAEFGIAAESAGDTMEKGVNHAVKFGVNASEFSKSFVKNLKKAQGYNFRNGIAGIEKMTIRAEKFKLSMETAAAFADKVQTPEGAIDMAAKLQVLGGAWAKLADPIKLMYDGRHDVEALHKSLIDATAGAAQWNAEQGRFEVGALEMQRLKAAAEATGMEYDKLATAAIRFSKDGKMKEMLDINISKEAREIIGTNGMFNQDSGKWEITVGDKTFDIDKLTSAMDDQIVQEDKSLKERAKNSKTFDEIFGNLVNSLKTIALPLLKGLANGLEPLANSLITAMTEGKFDEWATKMQNWGNSIQKWFADPAKKLQEYLDDPENGLGSALDKAITIGAGALGLALIGQAALWVGNGLLLAQGFNMGASVGGRGSGGGGMTKSGKSYKELRKGGMSEKSARARVRSNNRGSRMRSGAKGGGLMLVAQLGSMGLDYGREQLDDPNSNLGKGMGVASSALAWGGTGAMIGSIIPGVGTAIGAGVGALAGAGYGLYNEMENEKLQESSSSPMADDYIWRPGEGMQKFSGSDTVIGAKDGGAIDKMLSRNEGSSTGKVEISFAPMKIEMGNITINGKDTGINLDDPAIRREIAEVVKTQITKEAQGGKLSGINIT